MIERWEDSLRIGPASEGDVRTVERLLGVRFPADFIRVMRCHQGQIPVPRHLWLFDARRKTRLGPLMHTSGGHGGDIPNAVEDLRVGGYPHGLIPFAGAGSQTHFALDYRQSPDAPTVVFAVLELGYDDPRVFRHVANSVTELLDRLEPER